MIQQKRIKRSGAFEHVKQFCYFAAFEKSAKYSIRADRTSGLTRPFVSPPPCQPFPLHWSSHKSRCYPWGNVTQMCHPTDVSPPLTCHMLPPHRCHSLLWIVKPTHWCVTASPLSDMSPPLWQAIPPQISPLWLVTPPPLVHGYGIFGQISSFVFSLNWCTCVTEKKTVVIFCWDRKGKQDKNLWPFHSSLLCNLPKEMSEVKLRVFMKVSNYFIHIQTEYTHVHLPAVSISPGKFVPH